MVVEVSCLCGPKQLKENLSKIGQSLGALTVVFELAKGLQREGNRLVHEGQTQSSPELLWQQWQTLLQLLRLLPGLEAEADGDGATGELDEGAISEWTTV